MIVDGKGTVKPDGFNNMPANGYIDVAEENGLGLEVGFYTPVPGATGQTSVTYRPWVLSTDWFNPAPFNYSQTPNERAALWLLGSRPLGESTNLFLEAFAHHRESAQQGAPAFYRTGFARPTEGGHPVDNYYNPFGIDIPVIWRRVVEAGNRRTEQEVDLWRALIGLEGMVGGLKWELALQSAKAEATAIEKGFLARQRLFSPWVHPGWMTPAASCVARPIPRSGACLRPASFRLRTTDLFGGAGSITEEQLAYVIPGTMINRGTNEQRHAELVLGGPGGRILGRDVQWVLGAEYRREAGSQVPDPRQAAYVDHRPRFLADDLFVFRSAPEVSGRYDAHELFTAVQVPLVHDRPWARDMALNVGLRWSDFSSFDRHTTWQAGLRWQPAEALTLRANYGEILRAPSSDELFEQQVYLEEFPLDPCGNDPTPAQRANCAANGVPGGAYVQDGGGLMAVYGGNPELEPETGTPSEPA